MPNIILTPGEPAGIGPDVVLQAAQKAWQANLIAIADPALLSERAKQLGIAIKILETDIDEAHDPQIHQANTLKVIPVPLLSKVVAGKLNNENASYVIQTLKLASQLCLKNKAKALVTGPVNKSIMNETGIPFTGHTEYFAQQAGVDQTVMLFVTEQFKVALATTHLALKDVAAAISQAHLSSVLSVLHQGLMRWFHIQSPRLLVCGLNPHAGENGHLGREEIDILIPVIEKMNRLDQHITGPFPADTIFNPKYLQQADAILAMYHDQALPLVKYASFGRAVNMTLGLPFIRTSVDHGTALDIAGSGKADPGSFEAALRLAISLAAEPPSSID